MVSNFSRLPSPIFGHFCATPAIWFKEEFKNLKIQMIWIESNSMIGVDSDLFCAEKSIASDFKYLKSMLEPLCDIQVSPIVKF